jgi:hypothetical protein
MVSLPAVFVEAYEEFQTHVTSIISRAHDAVHSLLPARTDALRGQIHYFHAAPLVADQAFDVCSFFGPSVVLNMLEDRRTGFARLTPALLRGVDLECVVHSRAIEDTADSHAASTRAHHLDALVQYARVLSPCKAWDAYSKRVVQEADLCESLCPCSSSVVVCGCLNQLNGLEKVPLDSTAKLFCLILDITTGNHGMYMHAEGIDCCSATDHQRINDFLAKRNKDEDEVAVKLSATERDVLDNLYARRKGAYVTMKMVEMAIARVVDHLLTSHCRVDVILEGCNTKSMLPQLAACLQTPRSVWENKVCVMFTNQKMPSGCAAFMHACYGDSMAEEGITASLMAARELMEAWDDAFQRSQILTSNDEDDTAPLSGRIDGGKLNEFV